MASADPERKEEEEEAVAGEEEDTGAQIAPIVRLEEVAVTTGEEHEDVLLDLKSKLYRFDKEGNQWKERGVGTLKLLKHRETGKVRLVMRQSKTLKICANHLVVPSITMQEHAGNDKSCVWHAMDFSDGELKDEMFCIRFGSVENCKHFMEMFEKVAQSQGNTEENNADSDTENFADSGTTVEKNEASEEKTEGKSDATSAAELIEKLSVNENKSSKDEKSEAPVTGEEEKKPDAEKKDE